MQLASSQVIPARQSTTWDALMDPLVLKECIPGCELIELTGDNAYRVVIQVKIGPVSAKFEGKMSITDVNAPSSYTVSFQGQGGAMGFGKGKAQVTLQSVDGGTELRYSVEAGVGGKIAQVGARLIDAAAMKIAEDFFGGFRGYVEKRERSEMPATVTALEPGVVPQDEGPKNLLPVTGLRRLAWVSLACAAIIVAMYAFLRA